MINYKKLNNKKYKYCIYFLFVLYMKVKVPLKYVPERLNMKDKKKVKQELKKSRAKYKKGIYYTRKKVYESSGGKILKFSKENVKDYINEDEYDDYFNVSF